MGDRRIGLVILAAGLAGCTGGIDLGTDTDGGPDKDASVDGRDASAEASGPWVNHPDCPAEPPSEQETCTVPEATTCAYFSDNVEVECSCRMDRAGTTRYHCVQGTQGPSCPAVMPIEGSACTYPPGTMPGCFYPYNHVCLCTSDLVYQCRIHTGLQSGVSESGPASVDANRVVKDMTNQEAAAWCDWFVAATTMPSIPTPVCGASHDAAWLPVFYGGCTNFLCSQECQSSLRQAPCDATVGELSDCVLTIFDDGNPHPYGCGRFLGHAACMGVVVGDSFGDAGGSPGHPEDSCPIMY